MNKMIKLPLFLGVVGGLCGGLLAATNLITGPQIKKAEDARIAASYKLHFEACERVEKPEISEAAAKGGIIEIAKAFDSSDNSLGIVYTVLTKKGYGGEIKYTASVADNKIHKLILVSSGESAQGAEFLTAITGAEDYTLDGVVDFKSGSSVTYGAVMTGLTACLADYATQGGN